MWTGPNSLSRNSLIRSGKLFVMNLSKKRRCSGPKLFTETTAYVGSSCESLLWDLSGLDQPMWSCVFFVSVAVDSWRLEFFERLANTFRQCCLAAACFCFEEDQICLSVIWYFSLNGPFCLLKKPVWELGV